MASGIEIATAYVSIVGETSKLKKDIDAALDEAGKSSAKASKKIGENLSSGLGGTKNAAAKAGAEAAAEYESALKSSLKGERIGEAIGKPIGKGIGLAIKGGIGLAAAGATAAVGVLLTSLTKGFNRLKNIDAAKFQLEALGNSAADVKKIMDNATKAVKGTAFGLDAAATTAATAVAAGVKPGADLTAYLTTVADAAAIAGTSLDEMGSIFNGVQTSGNAMNDTLGQLADRGLPIFQWIAKEMGVAAGEVEDLASKGKVSAEVFNNAVAKNIGGAAQKMGESFEGAVANLDAALGRIGASLLGVPFGEASGGIGTITTALDNLNGWITQNQDALIGFWAGMADAAIYTARGTLRTIGVITEALGGFLGVIGKISNASLRIQAVAAEFRGDDAQAADLRKQADEAWEWGASMEEAGRKMQDQASDMGVWFTSVDQWAERAKNAGTLTKAFGDAVAEVKDDRIVITDNTPEVTKNLSDLGITLQNFDGEVRLVPNTPEAQKLIDAFLGKNNPTPPVPVPVVPQTDAADAAMQAFRDRWSKPLVVGVDILPGQTPAYPPGTIAPGDLGGLLGAGGVGSVPGGGGGPGGPVGNMPNGMVGAQGSQQPGAAFVDNIASQFGLTKTSGSRPGDDGYHGSGQAGDYAGSVADMQRFAAYMSQNFGSSLAEIIFDAKGWAGNVKNGQNTGAFGNVYTMDQAGDHSDHVHVAWAGFAGGGAARGPGGPKSDEIDAKLSDGEHVWTAAEVAAAGGHSAMYAMRAAALAGQIPGYNEGGAVLPLAAWGRPYDPRSDPDNNPWLSPSDQGGQGGKTLPSKVPPPGYKKGYEYAKPGPGNSIWIIARDGSPVFGGGFDGRRRGFNKRPPKPPSEQPDLSDPYWRNRRGVWGAGFADGGAVKLYDQGGIWPTDTLGLNATGEDEYVLTPEQIEELKKQGVDPATMQHGMGQGALPGPPSPEKLAQLTGMPGSGPTPEQLNGQPQGGDGAELMGGSRTEGYIPAGAGSTAVAGESFLSGIYSMGAEVINGLIDQAASAASSAAGMAATAFAPGSGGAASGLTSAAIGMGTQAIKRGVDYGAQMLGIVTDSFIEQATPFGAPRILSTDPTAFMPQQALMDAATTSLEKAFQPQQPEGPQAPEPVTAGASAHVNELEPGTGTAPQFNTTVNATVKDVNELNRTLNDQQRLNIMQYSGRP